MKLFSMIFGILLATQTHAEEITIGCNIEYNSQRNAFSTYETHSVEPFTSKSLTFGTYTLELGVGGKASLMTSESYNTVYISIWSPKYNDYVATEKSANPQEPAQASFYDRETLERLLAKCSEVIGN